MIGRAVDTGGSDRVLVVGSDPAAAVVARRMPDPTEFAGLDRTLTERVADDVAGVTHVDRPGEAVPPDTDIGTVVVATPDDGANLLVAQRAVLSGVEDVVVRLNDPARRPAFAALPARVVCTTAPAAEALLATCAEPAVRRE